MAETLGSRQGIDDIQTRQHPRVSDSTARQLAEFEARARAGLVPGRVYKLVPRIGNTLIDVGPRVHLARYSAAKTEGPQSAQAVRASDAQEAERPYPAGGADYPPMGYLALRGSDLELISPA